MEFVIVFIIKSSITHVNESKNKRYFQHRSYCSSNSTVCIRSISSKYKHSAAVTSASVSIGASALAALAAAVAASDKDKSTKVKGHEYSLLFCYLLFDDLYSDGGLEIHVVSLVFFSIMVWLRFYFSQRSLWLYVLTTSVLYLEVA
jgi:hypothetical protein